MNILFISYWSIKEGLTKSTVIPNVKILSGFKKINKIILVTIERDSLQEQSFIHPKIIHYPIQSRSFQIPLMDKVIDFYSIPRILTHLINRHEIQKIIARGSPAGALAYLTWKRNGVPFYVESFEPHATYMLETGVWKRWDPRYLLQKWWEKKQLKYASGLMPVSNEYQKELKKKDINVPVITVPCAVDKNSFSFNKKERIKIRNILNIKNQTTGIYAGKFGGLYLGEETFPILEALFSYFADLFLIILTPESNKAFHNKLIERVGQQEKLVLMHVDHQYVASYLSAADFGLGFYKSFKSSKYLSPIKIGEYWANGLPVLLTKGVGDESQFIEQQGAGALLDLDDPIPSFRKIKDILKIPGHRSKIPHLAEKYRSSRLVEEAYQRLI
jgi:hypothetical protein